MTFPKIGDNADAVGWRPFTTLEAVVNDRVENVRMSCVCSKSAYIQSFDVSVMRGESTCGAMPTHRDVKGESNLGNN